MSKFACIKECYAGNKLCKLGNVVGDEVAVLAPTCFHKLKARTPETINAEIEEVTNGAWRAESDKPAQYSNCEILKARKKG